ncbi:MAG: hypothetical protein ACPF95_00705 [Flavobacteriaceae bacterium]
MRLLTLCSVVVLLCCSQPKQENLLPKVEDTAVVDSILNSVLAEAAPSKASLNWSNLTQLMNSLGNTPTAQRSITLKTIKDESTKLLSASWPEEWNTNPIRSRYMVFVTHASIAADQRLNGDIAEQQAMSILKMKRSWNIFVSHIQSKETSAVFETTPQ